MKKLISFIAIILIIASASNLFAQKEKMDIIYMKDGGIYKGKIIVQTNDYIKIKTESGTYNPPLNNIRKIAQDGDSLENGDNQIQTDSINIIDSQLMKKTLIRNDFQPLTISYRNPGIATLMSLVFPGGGQFYNAQSSKGIGFFLWSSINSGVIIYALQGNIDHGTQDAIIIIAGISELTCWISGMIDANSMAKKINNRYIASFNLGNNKTLSFNPEVKPISLPFEYNLLSYGFSMQLSF